MRGVGVHSLLVAVTALLLVVVLALLPGAALVSARPSAITAASYQLVTFGPSDSSCSGSATGGIAFGADLTACTATPSSISATFHGMRIKNLDPKSGNYTLLLYFESPLCDDFVGLYLTGTVGDNKRACVNASYVKSNFYLQVRATSGNNQTYPATALW